MWSLWQNGFCVFSQGKSTEWVSIRFWIKMRICFVGIIPIYTWLIFRNLSNNPIILLLYESRLNILYLQSWTLPASPACKYRFAPASVSCFFFFTWAPHHSWTYPSWPLVMRFTQARDTPTFSATSVCVRLLSISRIFMSSSILFRSISSSLFTRTPRRSW